MAQFLSRSILALVELIALVALMVLMALMALIMAGAAQAQSTFTGLALPLAQTERAFARHGLAQSVACTWRRRST